MGISEKIIEALGDHYNESGNVLPQEFHIPSATGSVARNFLDLDDYHMVLGDIQKQGITLREMANKGLLYIEVKAHADGQTPQDIQTQIYPDMQLEHVHTRKIEGEASPRYLFRVDEFADGRFSNLRDVPRDVPGMPPSGLQVSVLLDADRLEELAREGQGKAAVRDFFS